MYADRRDAGAGAQLSSSRGRRDGGAGAHLPLLKGVVQMPPGASEPLPLGVSAGHQLLHLDDLHTSSFARTELGRRPFRESYGLPSHPSTGNSQPFMISIHALLTENALAAEFVSA